MVNNWYLGWRDRWRKAHCALCGAPTRDYQPFCRPCHAELPWQAHACRRCGLPLPLDSGALCGECLRQPPPYAATVAPFLYRYPVDGLVQQFKFQRRLHLARVLGTLLAEHVAIHGNPTVQALVPVPLHPARLRQRGFNQALELARHVGHRLGLPVASQHCRRTRDTSAQSTLPLRQRAANVRGVFALRRPLAARHVALVDDVMTSGHTVQCLTRVLLAGGVETVSVWVCARAVDGAHAVTVQRAHDQSAAGPSRRAQRHPP